jgi:putative transposase
VEQIIGVLKQAQVGVAVAEVIRKAGISEQTFTGGRPSTPALR